MSQAAENERTAFHHSVQTYLSRFSHHRWEEWINLWAEDSVLEFAPPGRRSCYVGKADVLTRTKEGKISLYRENWNPLVSMDTNGGREAWTAAFGSPEIEGAAS